MNPFLAANAVANPGQYAQAPVYEEENTSVESPLSAGGVAPNALNNLGGLAELLGGNNMSSSQDFSSGLGSVDFSNPYAGESGPVASRQVVDYSSQPVFNPVNNTYKAPSPTAPNMGVTGGQEFDYFGNRVSNSSNPFTLGEGTAGLFTANGTNMGDYVNSSLKSTFGDFYNEDFSTGKGAQYGVGSYGEYAAPNRAFSFGDKSLGQYGAEELGISSQNYGKGMNALGQLGQFSQASGRYDTANKINMANSLLGMTGNNAYDTLANMSGNKYATLLNDDWSPRATMSKALSFGNVPYAGSIMAGIDYSQGRNNYGALGRGIGMLAGATPLGILGMGIAGNWLGDEYGNKWNDNRVGPGREWAEEQGLQVGRPGYDKALNAWDKAARKGELNENQQSFVTDWNTDRQTEADAAAINSGQMDIEGSSFGNLGEAQAVSQFGVGSDEHMAAIERTQEGERARSQEQENQRTADALARAREAGRSVSTNEVSDKQLNDFNEQRMQEIEDDPTRSVGSTGPLTRDGGTDFSPGRNDAPSSDGTSAGAADTYGTTAGSEQSDMLAAQDAEMNDDSDSGGGGDSGCFIADTLVTDSTGKDKAISEYKIGDSVMSIDGKTANKVKYIEVMSWDDDYELYSPTTKLKPFITKNHPIKVEGKWVSADLDYTERNHPWIDAVAIDTPVIKKGKGIVVYNLWVDGDNTYTVNGYDTETLIGDGGIVRQGLEYDNINMEDFKSIIKSSLSSTPEVTYGMHILNMFMTFITNKKANKFMLDVILGKRDFMPISLFIYSVGKTAMIFKNKTEIQKMELIKEKA